MDSKIDLIRNFNYTFKLFLINSKNYIIKYTSYIPIKSLDKYINLKTAWIQL